MKFVDPSRIVLKGVAVQGLVAGQEIDFRVPDKFSLMRHTPHSDGKTRSVKRGADSWLEESLKIPAHPQVAKTEDAHLPAEAGGASPSRAAERRTEVERGLSGPLRFAALWESKLDRINSSLPPEIPKAIH